MNVVVLSAIPIPVGHRVAVRWYHKKSKGLFGGAQVESHPTQPLIEDLETGIVYAFTWLYDGVERLQEEGENGALAWPSRFGETMVKGIEEQRVVTVHFLRFPAEPFGGAILHRYPTHAPRD